MGEIGSGSGHTPPSHIQTSSRPSISRCTYACHGQSLVTWSPSNPGIDTPPLRRRRTLDHHINEIFSTNQRFPEYTSLINCFSRPTIILLPSCDSSFIKPFPWTNNLPQMDSPATARSTGSERAYFDGMRALDEDEDGKC